MAQSDFVQRGQALLEAGQFQEAVKICRLGLLGRPTTVEGRVVLGQALFSLGRFDEVLAEMRIALELDHGSVAAHVLKGEALLRKGDRRAAMEVLATARKMAPHDAHIAELLGEAGRVMDRPGTAGAAGAARAKAASQPPTGIARPRRPSVNYTRDVKPHYAAALGDEDSGPADYTRPTSPAHRLHQRTDAAPEPRPARGRNDSGGFSHIGTVEVDPSLVASEYNDNDTVVGDAAPRRLRTEMGPAGDAKRAPVRPAANASRDSDSGLVIRSMDMVEVDDTPPPVAVSPRRTAIRQAVGLASGPIDQPDRESLTAIAPPPSRPPTAAPAPAPAPAPPIVADPRRARPRTTTAGGAIRPAAIPASQPTQQAPQPQLPPGVPDPRRGVPVASSGAPTMTVPQPQLPAGISYPQAVGLTSSRPGVAIASPNAATPIISTPAEPPAQAHPYVPRPLGAPGPAQPSLPPQQQQPLPPGWQYAGGGGYPVAPGAHHAAPTYLGVGAIDPALASILEGAEAEAMQPAPARPMPVMKTEMRRMRSRWRFAVWGVLGALVIGGGVFAGVKIRAMRLAHQITDARAHADELAKTDSFGGWLMARDALADIERASDSAEHRAQLARARAVIAYELDDGVADARAAVAQLAHDGAGGGLDGALAVAYLALADGDAGAARTAADAALALAPKDPAALYASGQAAMLAGDPATALASLAAAATAEPRPFYLLGLARAHAELGNGSDASAAIDRALTAGADLPAAIVARAELELATGNAGPTGGRGTDARTALGKLVARASQRDPAIGPDVPRNAHERAELAIAELALGRGELDVARAHVDAAIAVASDDRRAVDALIEALADIGDAPRARIAEAQAVVRWPSDQRAVVALARAELAADQPQRALPALAALTLASPDALATRAAVKAALGDRDGAHADAALALQHAPKLDAALAVAVELELSDGHAIAALAKVAPRFAGKDATGGLPIALAYAAALRASDAAAQHDQARALLAKLATAAPVGDGALARLELARADGDAGDWRAAYDTLTAAATGGSVRVRVALAALAIEMADPRTGYDALLALAHELGDAAPVEVLVEAARASTLVGDHAGAAALLDRASKLDPPRASGFDRERARLALARGDLATAGAAISRAIEMSGRDGETLIVAADIVSADAAAVDKDRPLQLRELAARTAQLVPERLLGGDAALVTAMLALADGRSADAAAAYRDAADQLARAHATPRRRARASLGLAISALAAHDHDTASAQLDAAIAGDPTLTAAYLYRAELRADQKRWQDALADARRAVAFDPALVDGWLLVQQLAPKAGDSAAASAATDKLKALGAT